MAVASLGEICAAAVGAGVDPDLPVAIVENGSLERSAGHPRDAGHGGRGGRAGGGAVAGRRRGRGRGRRRVSSTTRPAPPRPAMADAAPPRARAVRPRHPRPAGARDRARGGGRGRRAAARASRCSRPTSTCTGRRSPQVVAGLTRAPGDAVAGVVVPLLLAAGYHVHVDIAQAVADRPDVRSTGALGPDDLLVDVLVERLEAAGAQRGGPVVLAPAGSSDARAQADSADMAAPGSNSVGAERCTSGTPPGRLPTVADAVTSARKAAGGSRSRWRRTCWRRGSSSGGSRSRGPTSSPGRSRRTRWSSRSCVARYRAALEA